MSSPRYQTRSNPFFLLFVEKPKEPTLCFQSFVMIHISHLEHFGRMTSGNSTLWNMIDDDTPSLYNSGLSDMSPSNDYCSAFATPFHAPLLQRSMADCHTLTI